MADKSEYKVVDCRGRVYLPKGFRIVSDIECGDIVKLTTNNGIISVSKVELIEVGNQSPEVMESFINASIKFMGKEKKLELIKRLTLALQEEKILN